MPVKSDCEVGLAFIEELRVDARKYLAAPVITTTRTTSTDESVSIEGDHYLAAFEIAKVICRATQPPHPFSTFEFVAPHIAIGQTEEMYSYARVFAIRDHPNCYAIIGPTAMHDIIAALSATLVATEYRVELGISLEELDLAYRAMRAQISGLRNGGGWRRGVRLKLPEHVIRISNTLTLFAEVFIFLHEFAHIATGDLENPLVNQYDFILDGARLGRSGGENFCDFVALDALLDAPISSCTPDVLARSVELALSSQSILEVVNWWQLPPSHSTSRARLSYLKSGSSNTSRAATAWRKVDAWWTRPRDLAALLSQGGPLHPYGDKLSEALLSSPRLFQFTNIDEFSEYYDSMDRLDQGMRYPVTGLYRQIYEKSFPRSDGRWIRIYDVSPRPPHLHSTIDELIKRLVDDPSQLRSVVSLTDKFEWAATAAGYAIVHAYVLPRLNALASADRGTDSEDAWSLVEGLVGTESAGGVVAILVQSRAGVAGAILPLVTPDACETILEICGLPQ